MSILIVVTLHTESVVAAGFGVGSGGAACDVVGVVGAVSAVLLVAGGGSLIDAGGLVLLQFVLVLWPVGGAGSGVFSAAADGASLAAVGAASTSDAGVIFGGFAGVGGSSVLAAGVSLGVAAAAGVSSSAAAGVGLGFGAGAGSGGTVCTVLVVAAGAVFDEAGVRAMIRDEYWGLPAVAMAKACRGLVAAELAEAIAVLEGPSIFPSWPQWNSLKLQPSSGGSPWLLKLLFIL
ncbi:hypothetical protein ACOSQ2_017791 [Xanthoceras sorbifolium]